MSDTPEDEVPQEETSTDQVAAESTAEDAPTGKSPWLWFVAGLVAAILMPIVVSVVLSNFQAPLPIEYEELTSLQTPSAEQSETMNKMLEENQNSNRLRFTFGNGAAVAIVFGLFAGIISGRVGLGILGALVGVGVMYLVAMLGTSFMLDLEQKAVSDLHSGDTKAMMLHAIQWGTFGLAAFVAVLIGFGKPAVSVKFLGAALLASVLGAVLYVIGATILDPSNNASKAIPVEGTGRYLWASVVPLLIGLFMARTKRV